MSRSRGKACLADPRWQGAGSFPLRSADFEPFCERRLQQNMQIVVCPSGDGFVVFTQRRASDRNPMPAQKEKKGVSLVRAALQDVAARKADLVDGAHQESNPWRLLLLFACFLMAVGTYLLVQENEEENRRAEFNETLREQQADLRGKYLHVQRSAKMRNLGAEEDALSLPPEQLLGPLPEGLFARVELTDASPLTEDLQVALDWQVLDAVRAIRLCYHQGLLDHPEIAENLKGTMTVGIDFAPQGTVTRTNIVKRTFPLRTLDDCIIDPFSKLRLPPRSGGEMTISYTFAFSPRA